MGHLIRAPFANTDAKPKLKPKKKSWIKFACNHKPSSPRLYLAEYAPDELVRTARAWHGYCYALRPAEGLPGMSQLAKADESLERQGWG